MPLESSQPMRNHLNHRSTLSGGQMGLHIPYAILLRSTLLQIIRI